MLTFIIPELCRSKPYRSINLLTLTRCFFIMKRIPHHWRYLNNGRPKEILIRNKNSGLLTLGQWTLIILLLTGRL